MQGELLYRAATNVHEMIGSTIYSKKKSVAWAESKNPNLSLSLESGPTFQVISTLQNLFFTSL